MRFGLLGRKLGHSYSPMIFDLMGGYEYLLHEREPEGIEDRLVEDPAGLWLTPADAATGCFV